MKLFLADVASLHNINENLHENHVRPVAVTWCRRLPKDRRHVVVLHTAPLPVTGTHRVILAGGLEKEAKDLRTGDIVMTGATCGRDHARKSTPI